MPNSEAHSFHVLQAFFQVFGYVDGSGKNVAFTRKPFGKAFLCLHVGRYRYRHMRSVILLTNTIATNQPKSEVADNPFLPIIILQSMDGRTQLCEIPRACNKRHYQMEGTRTYSPYLSSTMMRTFLETPAFLPFTTSFNSCASLSREVTCSITRPLRAGARAKLTVTVVPKMTAFDGVLME